MNSEITPAIRHIRPVKWLKTIPRSQFDQDLLYSLGAFTTVCQIKRNDAENRVLKILEKGGNVRRNETTTESVEVIKDLDLSEIVDIEQHSRDQIVKYVGAKFSDLVLESTKATTADFLKPCFDVLSYQSNWRNEYYQLFLC
jgi:restriction system protein